MSIQTHQKEPNDGLPDHLPSDFVVHAKLTREQAGHLRHFYNLASSLDGEWSLMGNQEPAQEWLDAYRYQLAVMAYGAGAAHYHRLPAARSVFKPLMKKLITKMLRREVWGYWYLTSQSGVLVDPSLKEMRKPWSDPVCRENIMYSGHLLLMISLYSMLFDDDTYDQRDALVFLWNPIFWGFGPERFTYNRSSLQETIMKEMESNGWMGVCCEPNCVFVVCNQFPLIAMRYNDVRNGTDKVDEVLEKYKSAWAKKGLISELGFFRDVYRVKQDDFMDANDLAFTAWASAMMNSWNSSTVHKMLKPLSVGFLTRTPDNRINVNQAPLANAIRSLVSKEQVNPHAPGTLARAREIVAKQVEVPRLPFTKPTFGYCAKWLSEVGEPGDLDGLLRHADIYLNPKWREGGLYYQRCETLADADGNWTHVDPFTGNAALGYARLNVPDGQKKMWEHPWTSQDIASRPWIDGISMENGLDILSGAWDAERQMMVATMRTWDGSMREIRPVVNNLPPGVYGVYLNGAIVEKKAVTATESSIAIDIEVGGEEVDVVFLRSPFQLKSLL